MIPPLVLGGNLVTMFTGFAKTGIPGVGILAAILLANLMDETRASVGTLLPLLIFADMFAVGTYRKHTDWGMVRRILPPTLVGVGVGALSLGWFQGDRFDVMMGSLVLGQLGLDTARRRFKWESLPHHPGYALFFGVLAGFTTTLGNMAGPLMTLYFMSLGLEKHRFMGSMAWYFLLVNVVKVPIFIWHEMITMETVSLSVRLMPGVVVGALFGRRVFRHIPQKPFEVIVRILAALAAIRLLWI